MYVRCKPESPASISLVCGTPAAPGSDEDAMVCTWTGRGLRSGEEGKGREGAEISGRVTEDAGYEGLGSYRGKFNFLGGGKDRRGGRRGVGAGCVDGGVGGMCSVVVDDVLVRERLLLSTC